jgi:hypothetical protein
MLSRAKLPPGCEGPGRESSRWAGNVRSVAVARCGLGVVAIGAAAVVDGGAATAIATVVAANATVVVVAVDDVAVAVPSGMALGM